MTNPILSSAESEICNVNTIQWYSNWRVVAPQFVQWSPIPFKGWKEESTIPRLIPLQGNGGLFLGPTREALQNTDRAPACWKRVTFVKVPVTIKAVYLMLWSRHLCQCSAQLLTPQARSKRVSIVHLQLLVEPNSQLFLNQEMFTTQNVSNDLNNYCDDTWDS